MRVLVTGGAGFIGSNFILNQIKNGNIICNFDKLTYASTLESLKSLDNHPYYFFKKGDIANKNNVHEVINEFKPDKIVNFAAESHVDRSIEGPEAFIQTNIYGTYILLEESLLYYNKMSNNKKMNFRFLHVSTDEVFGSLGNIGSFNEQTPYDPSSPYSASKASSDHLVMAWYRTYKLPVIITNCSNNYGPFQFPEKLIPLMIINAVQNKKLPIYGTGKNIRDWLFVLDHCKAIDIVLKKGKVGNSYLIGGNSEKTNLVIVKSICDILNTVLPKKGFNYNDLIEFVIDRPGHDFRYSIDASKIKNELNWTPQVKFSDGIKQTIYWYLENKEWWKKIQQTNYNQSRLGMR